MVSAGMHMQTCQLEQHRQVCTTLATQHEQQLTKLADRQYADDISISMKAHEPQLKRQEQDHKKETKRLVEQACM